MVRRVPLFNFCACAVIAANSLLSLPAAASPSASGEAAIQAEYVQMNAAFVRHDLTDVMSYFMPDYTQSKKNGDLEDLDQTKRDYQNELKQISTMQSRYSVLHCDSVPAGMEVEIRVHSDGTGIKHVLFATLKGSFTNDLWVRDLWVDTPSGWRLRHRQIFEDSTHIHL